MSPLIATLECPHGNGEDSCGAEGVRSVGIDGDGKGRKDHLKGGIREDRCVLLTREADSKDDPRRQNREVLETLMAELKMVRRV